LRARFNCEMPPPGQSEMPAKPPETMKERNSYTVRFRDKIRQRAKTGSMRLPGEVAIWRIFLRTVVGAVPPAEYG
jgi:hypothetical protein